MKFDYNQRAIITIANLQKILNIVPTTKQSLLCPYTIGSEVEVKFKYYFPELYKLYFVNRYYYTLSYEQQQEINKIIDVAEAPLKKILESVEEAGVMKGADKFWEFAFYPVQDLSLLATKIDILRTANLIPSGEHSFHITIGGLKVTPVVYYILMILELLYVRKERIIEGFGKERKEDGCWAKKGKGGILYKEWHELINCNNGFEFRTLMLYDDTNVYELLKTLNHFLIELYFGKKSVIVQELRLYMNSLGLPDVNWGKPYKNPEIWDCYKDNFDLLSAFAKDIFHNTKTYESIHS